MLENRTIRGTADGSAGGSVILHRPGEISEPKNGGPPDGSG